MKPVSVIFLLVSVVLVITGIIMCSAAMLQANNTGVELYDTVIVDGRSEAVYDFSSENISKIQIDVNDCNVEIVYGASEDKVIIRNFSSAGYVYDIENKAVLVEDAMNISSLEDVLIDVAQGDFHFKGFRYFLRDRELSGEQKEITVYLSGKFDIKVVDVAVENGMISVKNGTGSTDYTLYAEKGDIYLSDTVTDSVANLETGEGNIRVMGVTASSVEMKTGKGNIDADISACTVNAESAKGNVTVISHDDLEKFNYNLYSPKGTITLGELTKQGSHRAVNAMLTNLISATAYDGNISVKPYVGQVDGEETQESGTSQTETSAE